MAGLETCHRTDVFANKFDAFLCHCFWAVAMDMFSFDGDKGHGNFSLDLIMGSNDDSLCDLGVFHQNFLHLSSRQSVSGSVYHIVFSGHDVEISILVVVARISRVVVPDKCGKVFVDENIVVVEDRQHEGGRHGLFNIHCSCLIRLALDSGGRIDDFDVVSG